MAKRFTDTGIWKKPWFRKLSPRLKELWRYLCESCDEAGIWEPDFELASFHIGESVSEYDFVEFDDRVQRLPNGKIFIRSFVQFQYVELRETCNPHKKVIFLLHKNGIDPINLTLKVPLTKGTLRVQEQDKEEEQDKEKEEGGLGETKTDLIQEFLEKIPQKAQDAWVVTYEDEAWIQEQIKKAFAWIASNPKKAPKSDYSRFMNGWLSRSWEDHRKTIPSAVPQPIPIEIEKCLRCKNGIFKATNRSSGRSEWVACNCVLGRKLLHYARFDEQKFKVMT